MCKQKKTKHKLPEHYKGYTIRQTSKGDYVVIAKDGIKHSHMKRPDHCRQLIDFIVRKVIPKSRYWIMAVMRLIDETCEYFCRLEYAYENFNPKPKCVKRAV